MSISFVCEREPVVDKNGVYEITVAGMECLACQTGAMNVMNLAEHFNGRRHNRAWLVGKAMKFVCRLCDDSGDVSGGDGEWLCKDVESPRHREKLVEELMTFRGWPHRFLRAAPEELQRQVELAKKRVDAHLRMLDWVLEGALSTSIN